MNPCSPANRSFRNRRSMALFVNGSAVGSNRNQLSSAAGCAAGRPLTSAENTIARLLSTKAEPKRRKKALRGDAIRRPRKGTRGAKLDWAIGGSIELMCLLWFAGYLPEAPI